MSAFLVPSPASGGAAVRCRAGGRLAGPPPPPRASTSVLAVVPPRVFLRPPGSVGRPRVRLASPLWAPPPAFAGGWLVPHVCATGGGEDIKDVIKKVAEELAEEKAERRAGADAKARPETDAKTSNGEGGADGDGGSGDGDSDGGEGGGGDDGQDGGDGDDDGDAEGHDTAKELIDVLPDEQQEAVKRAVADENVSRLAKLTSILNGMLSRTLSTILATIPAPVLVSIIGVFTTYMGHRFQRYQAAESAKRKAEEARRDARAKQEADMAEFYTEFTGPLLRATAKLQERLHCLAAIKTKALAAGSAVGIPHPPDVYGGSPVPADEARDPAHLAYLLARYFGVVERLKGGSAAMDFGRPAADRIFLNLVGRVQGILSASDGALTNLQRSEMDFSASTGRVPAPAGPLRVVTHHQSVVGELMLRSHWYGDGAKAGGGGGTVGGKGGIHTQASALISYRDFCRLLDTEAEMQRWVRPLMAEAWRLIHNIDPPPPPPPRRHAALGARFYDRSAAATGGPPPPPPASDLPITDARLRRHLTADAARSAGGPVELARIYFLQNALVDLIDFLDPPPTCRFIPAYRRKRLRLAGAPTPGQTRMPESLLDLYRELADVHSGHIPQRRDSQRRGGSKTVEVYVKAPVWRAPSHGAGTQGKGGGGGEAPADDATTVTATAAAAAAGGADGGSAPPPAGPSPAARLGLAPAVDKGVMGDCPFSQRVVMALEEMCVPYELHKVNTLVKPPWFHILTAEGKVPLLYHEGRLIDDSSQIVSYLQQRFPKAHAVRRRAQLPLLLSEGQLTAFGGVFREWLTGAPTVGAPEVEAELRVVEGVLAQNAELRKGPFLGGRRFCWEDLALVPQLYHVEVAGEAFRGWAIPPSLPHTRAYLAAAKRERSFVKSAPSTASIYAGYGRLVEDGPEVVTELPDIIE